MREQALEKTIEILIDPNRVLLTEVREALVLNLRVLCSLPTELSPAPPAPEVGEVARELVAELELMASHVATACQFGDAKILSDAATLLQQQAAELAALRGVPVAECPHCGYEGEMAPSPQTDEVQP